MQTEAFGAELKKRGFCDFVGVPCSYLAPLINWAINENVFVMANNEGEAVAIASGISLCNSSLTQYSREFGKSSLDRLSVLSRSDFPAQPTNLTQDTRIADSMVSNTDSSDLKNSPSLAEGARGWVDSTIESTSESRENIKKTNARKYGVVLMQNSGLSNALSPLTSLNHTFEIPILGFVSLRGEPNQAGQNTDEPQHELLGKITDKLLQTCDIECAFLDSRFEVACEQLEKAQKVLESNKSFFFIVRNSCFEKVALTNNPLSNSSLTQSSREFGKSSLDRQQVLSRSDFPAQPTNLTQDTKIANSMVSNTDSSDLKDSPSPEIKVVAEGARGWVDSHESAQKTNTQKPTRLQALQIIQNIGTNCALLATTGKCGRELYELDDKPNQLYMVGSMGCVSALGLGVALKSHKKVIAIDGDSALLMRLGTLSGNAYYARCANKSNFCHILLDNQSHDSTGGQFNLSPFVDFVAIAKSCGYAVARSAKDLDELSAILREFVSAKNGGAWFVYLSITKGSKKDLGRPKITPKQVAQRFSAWLNENPQCADKTHNL